MSLSKLDLAAEKIQKLLVIKVKTQHKPVQAKTHVTHAVLNSAYKAKSPFPGLPCVLAHNPL